MLNISFASAPELSWKRGDILSGGKKWGCAKNGKRSVIAARLLSYEIITGSEGMLALIL